MKIFSDRRYLPSGVPHVPLLYPFWGPNAEPRLDPMTGRFDAWTAAGSSVFEMTDPARSDVAVLPGSWENLEGRTDGRELARELAAVAKEKGKPLVVFYWSDSDLPVPLDGAIVFRTSLYRSSRGYREFAMPAWSEDFLHRYLDSKLPLRTKEEVPVVGFCGFADAPNLRGRAKSAARRTLRAVGLRQGSSGLAVRRQALSYLSKQPGLRPNFLIRDRFLAGADSSNHSESAKRARDEFVKNIVDSDYVLCARGAGNFSYRLYETLCCGRIPLFVDTDCVLPYDAEIDWRQFCVWIDEAELAAIGDKLLEFHSRISPDEFRELQRSCRKFWEERLSPQGFFSFFQGHF